MREILSNKLIRKLVLLFADAALVNLAALLALEIRFDFNITGSNIEYKIAFIDYFVIYTCIVLVIFYLFGLYRSLWRYASINEMMSIALSAFWSNIAIYITFLLLDVNMPRSFYIINMFTMAAFVGGLRFSYRVLRRIEMGKLQTNKLNRPLSKVLIIGAGEAGVMTAKELLRTPDMNKVLVGFVDDDSNKIGKKINGIPIVADISSGVKFLDDADEIILAMPSITHKRRKEIIEIYKDSGVKMKILPGIYELIDGQVDIKKIRDVDIEDLLGRDSIALDNTQIAEDIKNKTVIVTGGGGSIGSELCRQIASFSPKLLIIFDIYENSAYDIQNELKSKYPTLPLKVLIGSVRDINRLDEIFSKYRPQLVFHAAAHKHVPLMEDSPFEAIKNNTVGTKNLSEIAGKYQVQRFVLISTDKAVNPTNIMGASKRLAELVIQDMNKKYNTEYVAVRFGNVLGSNGSVIPLFKKQIEKGGPITVTHPDIIRYFMTIPEAVQLVLQAGSMAKGGEIFILDMGEPVKIVDLAEDLIRLSGFEPYDDIDIEFTGLRPGEKLFEELLLAEEGILDTKHEKIFVGKPFDKDDDFTRKSLDGIIESTFEGNYSQLEQRIKFLIPSYRDKLQHKKA